MITTSLWLDAAGTAPETDPFPAGARFDVAVVGAGLTGLATAVMLSRAGLSVAVLEARTIGAVTSGRTTGKLSLLQGSVFSGIRRSHSDDVLRAYVDGNRSAQQWLLAYLAEKDVPVERRDAFTYAVTPDGAERLEREIDAIRAAGLEIEEDAATDLPFDVRGAIRLRDQAQFDPVAVLRALAADLRSRGGTIAEGVRVTGVDAAEPCVVCTTQGEITATNVVIATGIPILDRGLYFAKVQPTRSFVQAFRVSQPRPRGMYLSLDSPARSLRTADIDGAELLLAGGNGYVVGREHDTRELVRDLSDWVETWFPGAERTHAWSAQDYRSANRVPFVGWMPRTSRRIAVATGYDKWGMTNAVAAAQSISADILGEELAWARTLHRRVTKPAALASGVAMNAEVGGHLVADWASAETHPLPAEPPAEGEGVVGASGAGPVARSRVDGHVCSVSAICTHLGGILTWNTAERSWDCPLHGSRFDPRGRLLEGPATDDLAPADTAPGE